MDFVSGQRRRHAKGPRRLGEANRPERQALLDRVQRARQMLGGTDALSRFGAWKAPEER
jgi:hypothetical protein